MSKPVCSDVQELIEPYLDDDLQPAELASFERHLACCESCSSELAWARQVGRRLRALPSPACPAPTARAVLERARRESAAAEPTRRPPGRPSVWGLLRGRAAVAAGVLVIGLMVVVLRPELDSPQTSEVVRAEREARLALAYFGAINHRATVTLRDEILTERLVDAPRAALSRVARDR